MLQLMEAAERSIADGTMRGKLTTPDSGDGDSFSISRENDEADIEFTTLKWNSITKKYYQMGVLNFWFSIARMYLTFLMHSDWSVVRRLPLKIVGLFLFAPFAIAFLFSLYLFLGTTLLAYFLEPLPTLAWIGCIALSAVATIYTLDSAAVPIFLRGLLFSADSFVSEPDLLDSHVNEFKERILRELQEKQYDEVIVLGFSHGCSIVTLLMSEIYESSGKEIRDKVKAMFVAHYLPFGMLLKSKTKLGEAVLKLKSHDVTFFNVFNSCDSVCSSKNPLFFPYEGNGIARIANLDTQYENYLAGSGRLKAKLTFHYAHTLYFRPLDIPCPHAMINVLCSPTQLEKNPAFSVCKSSGNTPES